MTSNTDIRITRKPMREVRRWLRRQPFYKSFRTLVFMEEDRTLRDKLLVLWGYWGDRTIIEAFNWSLTVQGVHEWWKINRVFMEWYYNQ